MASKVGVKKKLCSIHRPHSKQEGISGRMPTAHFPTGHGGGAGEGEGVPVKWGPTKQVWTGPGSGRKGPPLPRTRLKTLPSDNFVGGR